MAGLHHVEVWVDDLTFSAGGRDRYPHAGGPDHDAGRVENSAGFKAEIVADRM